MYARTDSPKYLCRKCNNKIPIVDLDAVFHQEMKAFFADSKKLSVNLAQADQTLKDRQTLIASHQQSIQKVRDEMKQTHRLYVEGHITPQGFGDYRSRCAQQLERGRLLCYILRGEKRASAMLKN
jgi:site-specific DNA recombinase